jgi:hypothetical protein
LLKNTGDFLEKEGEIESSAPWPIFMRAVKIPAGVSSEIKVPDVISVPQSNEFKGVSLILKRGKAIDAAPFLI